MIRTANTTAISLAMRVADDYAAAPMLADALEDAGNEYQSALRTEKDHIELERLVAIAYSPETEESVKYLDAFCEYSPEAPHDCPDYRTVISAASGRHDHDEDTRSWVDDWDGEGYLHFDTVDAHGKIPEEFWDHVLRVCGRCVESRPSRFSCSC